MTGRAIIAAELICLAVSLSACGTPPAGGSAGSLDADVAACRAEARERLLNTPAVRTGQTVYLPEGARPFYESCMAARGHAEYPPY